MRKLATFIVLIAGLGGGAAIADTQPLSVVDFNAGPGGGFGNLYLLGQEAVQKDLGLTESQAAQIGALVRELAQKQQDYGRETNAEQRRRLVDEIVALRLRSDARAAAVLTPEQAVRLRQVTLRYKGNASLWDPDVRNSLGLTTEQLQRIEALGREPYSARNRAAEEQFRKDRDFPAYQKKLEEARRLRDQDQLAVLTAEQRARWDKLVGDPFAGPIPSPIRVEALALAPPARPAATAVSQARPPQAEPAAPDAVGALAAALTALTREFADLKAEIRRLREDNARLQQASRQPATSVPGGPPRFLDRGDYVEDLRTGLQWQKDGSAAGKVNYYDAIRYAAGLKLGGKSGWRLPTRTELASIFPADEAPFTGTPYNPAPYGQGSGEWASYWTADLDRRAPNYAWVLQWYGAGTANNCSASANRASVRCVRDPLP